MAELGDPKAALHHYLQATRDDLIWKLEELSERRSPQVIAGTVLRDAGVRRDDACVLVARATP